MHRQQMAASPAARRTPHDGRQRPGNRTDSPGPARKPLLAIVAPPREGVATVDPVPTSRRDDVLSGAEDRAAAFHSFYAAEYPALLARLSRRLNRAQAEELCQEAFTRAWQNWDDVVSCVTPRAWLATVARRLMIDTWRRDATAANWAPVLAGRPETPEPGVDTVFVRDGMSRLTADHRQVLELFYFQDLDVRRIALTTGLTEAAVKSRLFAARRALAVQLRREAAQATPCA